MKPSFPIIDPRFIDDETDELTPLPALTTRATLRNILREIGIDSIYELENKSETPASEP